MALEPLAVYDVRDGSYVYERFEPFRQWAADQGLDINATCRVEIHLLDMLFARVTAYVRDETTGNVRLNELGDPLTRVYDIPVSEKPPQAPLSPARPGL